MGAVSLILFVATDDVRRKMICTIKRLVFSMYVRLSRNELMRGFNAVLMLYYQWHLRNKWYGTVLPPKLPVPKRPDGWKEGKLHPGPGHRAEDGESRVSDQSLE
jgi:hypothetical protein